jgi:guanosine-3',5'-bis(diphosphate) 3'-pyrophosphohydrolase
MSADVVALARALDFAARKHAGQRRKGMAAEPYVNHLADVARMVAEATEGEDTVAVVAALLHDTIEDTGTTREELEREFGSAVAAVVAEVTDDKTLPKAERKRLQVASAPGKSARAKMIKLADKTSNLRSITASPPVGWDWQRQRDYFDWAERVADGCRGVNPTLESWFDAASAEGVAALDRAR